MTIGNRNLFAFSEPSAVNSWVAVNDKVMGGESTSELSWNEHYASFRGEVSPENNGGFASIRASLDNALSKRSDHLWIESRGDGKLYSLLLRTNETASGISYQTDFRSTSEFSRIEFPLTEFKAQFRGRAVIDAPELMAEDIQQLGIMISERQFGAFQLDVIAIGATDIGDNFNR